MATKSRKSKKSSGMSTKVTNIKAARKSTGKASSSKKKSGGTKHNRILDTDQIAKQMSDFIKELVGAKKKQSKSKKTSQKKSTKVSTLKRKAKAIVGLEGSTKKKTTKRKKPSKAKKMVAMKSVTTQTPKAAKKAKKSGRTTTRKRSRAKLSLVKH